MAAAALLLAAPALAQWRNLPTDGIPLDAKGNPNMSAPAPRTRDGRIDLSGIYVGDIRYFRNLAADLGLENVPMTTEAREIRRAREGGALSYLEPDSRCLPQGVPKINMAPVPFRIVQTDRLVVLVYEAFTLWRQVFLDDREYADDLNPSWLGYSKGRWEGDELVGQDRSSDIKARQRTLGSRGLISSQSQAQNASSFSGTRSSAIPSEARTATLVFGVGGSSETFHDFRPAEAPNAAVLLLKPSSR
jgi:hypothetical protein